MVDWHYSRQETGSLLCEQEENRVSFRLRAGTEVASVGEAVKQVLERYRNSDSSPFLIAAYGLPDSGKSFFLSTLKQQAEESGNTVIGRFDSAAVEGEFARLPERYGGRSYIYVSHHGVPAFNEPVHRINRRNSELQLRLTLEEPNAFAVAELGREVDMMLAVYNPTHQRQPAGPLYDVLLANESASRKSTL